MEAGIVFDKRPHIHYNISMNIDEVNEMEKKLQKAILHIHKKYGKNALLKGMNLLDDATMKEMNR